MSNPSVHSFATVGSVNTGLGLNLVKASTVERYLSLDLKIKRALRRFENVLFASIYAMVQENSFRIKFALLGVIIDFLQVMAFTLSADFGWGSDFDLVFSWFLAPVRAMTWGSYSVIFWITIVVILSAFAVGYYVGYSFATGDFARIFPMKYMRTVVNLLLGVLYMPVLTILLVPFKVSASTNTLRNFPAIVAWGTEAMPPAVVSLIVLSVFIPICLLLALLNFEFGSRSTDFMARHTSWFDFIYLVLKTVLTLVTNLALDANGERAIIMLFATGSVTVFVGVVVPYYNIRINILRAGLFTALFGAAISTVVKVFGRDVYSSVGMSIGSVFGVHIGFIVLCGVCGALLMYARLKHMLSRSSVYAFLAKGGKRKKSTSVELAPIQATQRADSLGGAGIGVSSPKVKRHGSQVSGSSVASSQRGRGLLQTKNIAFSSTTASAAKPFQSLLSSIKSLFIVAQVMARTKFLQESSTGVQGTQTEDMVRLAESVFQKSIDSESSPALHILYANFISNWREDWVMAMAQLRKANSQKIGFYHRWLSYTVAKRIERMRRASRLGAETSSVDLMKYIEFQHAMEKARRYHYSSLLFVRQFWECLLIHNDSRMLIEMGKMQQYISKAQSRALYTYSHLITRFPNSPILWRSYGCFLRDVAIEPDEAIDAFNTADEIEEARMKHSANVRMRAADPAGAARPGRPAASPSSGPETSANRMEAILEEEPPLDLVDRDTGQTVAHTDETHSVHSRRSRHSRATGTSTSSMSAETMKRALGTRDYTPLDKLHFYLLLSAAVAGVVIAGIGGVGWYFLDAASSSFNSAEQVFGARSDFAWAMIDLNALVVGQMLNYTDIGLGQASWSLTGNLSAAEVLTKVTERVTNSSATLDSLYGASTGSIRQAWNSPLAQLTTFGADQKQASPMKATLYEATKAMVGAISSISAAIKSGSIKLGDMYVPASTDFQFGLFNTFSGLGGTWDLLDEAYLAHLAEYGSQLSLILPIAFASIMVIAGFAFLGVVVPGLNDVHADLHMSHALLTLISTEDIQHLRERALKNENEMMKQVVDIDGDREQLGEATGDDRALHGLEAREKKRKKLAQTGTRAEAYLFNTSRHHVKQCSEMRSFLIIYFSLVVIGICGVLAAVLLTSGQLSSDVFMSKQVRWSGMRMGEAGILAQSVLWLPEAMQNMVDDKWSGNLRQTISSHVDTMLQLQHWLVYGVNETTDIAYQYNRDHMPTLLAQNLAGSGSFIRLIKALMAVNSTQLTYAHPLFGHIVNIVNSRRLGGGTFIEMMTDKYIANARVNQAAAVSQTTLLVVIVELYLAFVLYVWLVRNYIVAELRERANSCFRMVQMVPYKVIRNVPLIRSWMSDRKMFLQRIHDSAKADKSKTQHDDAFDSALLPAYITESEIAYVVTKDDRVPLYANDAAKATLPLSMISGKGNQNDTALHPLDHMIHSSHRVSLQAAYEEASNEANHTASTRVVVHRQDGTPSDGRVEVTWVSMKGSHGKAKMFVTRWDLDDSCGAPAEGIKSETDKVLLSASRLLWESSPTIVVSPSGRLLAINTQAIDLFPTGHQIDVGQSFTSLFDDDSSKGARNLIRMSLTDFNRSTSRRLNLAGNSLPVKVTVQCSKYTSVDEVQYAVIQLENLVDSLAVEKSVRHLEAKDRALMNSLPQAVIVVDDDNVVSVNDSALKLFGYTTRDGMLGNCIDDMIVGGHVVWQSVNRTPGQWSKEVIKQSNSSEKAVKIMVQPVDADEGQVIVFSYDSDTSFE